MILLATAVLGYLLVRLLLQPIRALERFASDQETAAPLTPPAHFGTRELHATASRVVEMAETQRDREASIRAHTDHVTHELKSPVAAIRAAVELLSDSPVLTAEDRALLSQIGGAGLQMERQLAALRTATQAKETRHLGWSTLAEVMPALTRDWQGLALQIDGAKVRLPLAAAGGWRSCLAIFCATLPNMAPRPCSSAPRWGATGAGSWCATMAPASPPAMPPGSSTRSSPPDAIRAAPAWI